MTWQLVYTKQAQKDAQKISKAGLKSQVQRLLNLLKENPFKSPPGYEKLVGDLAGVDSCRINIKHRLVYQILEKQKIVKIIRMWAHYE